MEEIISYSSYKSRYDTNPIRNIKNNSALSYGEKTNLIRWVNSIDDPLCKQVNSIGDLKQANTIIALLYQYLTKINNFELLNFLDSVNINTSNEKKMTIALKILYKLDNDDYIKNNYNFFQKTVEEILNDNYIIFDIIKCINNLYQNISNVNNNIYKNNSSPNILNNNVEYDGRNSIKYLKTESSRIKPPIEDFYNFNIRKKVIVTSNSNSKYDRNKNKIYKKYNHPHFSQNLSREKRKDIIYNNNNIFDYSNRSYSQNNLNIKNYLMNSESSKSKKNYGDLQKAQEIYFPVKLFSNNKKPFRGQKTARNYLLEELEKLNEFTDSKNKNIKTDAYNSYNSYKRENSDASYFKTNNLNFDNNYHPRALSQNTLLIKNSNNKKNDYRNKLYYKTVVEYKKNNNLTESMIIKANQEEKINKNNLNIKNMIGLLSFDKNITVQDNISSNIINIYKILKLSSPIIDISYNQIKKYDNSKKQTIDLNNDNKNENIENKILIRNNSSLQTPINLAPNINIINDFSRNNSLNFNDKMYIKTDTIPPSIKNIVYIWLSDIELINKDTINIESLPIACSDGIILCDIINRFESRNNLIKGVFRKITTRSQCLVNIKKALEHLKQIGKFPLKHLWHAESISEGDEKVIWEILYDLYKYYSKISGYRTNYRNQLINENNSYNYVHKQNDKSVSFRETSIKKNEFLKNYNDILKNSNIFIINNKNNENLEKGGMYSGSEGKKNEYNKNLLKTNKDDGGIKNFDFLRTQYDKNENGNDNFLEVKENNKNDKKYKKTRIYYGINKKWQDKIKEKYKLNYDYNKLNPEIDYDKNTGMINKNN